MTRMSKGLLISLVSAIFGYQSIANAEQIKSLSSDQIRPTQPAIGSDEVKYKITVLQADKQKLFQQFCEDNGAKGVKSYSATSSISQPTSFHCLAPYATEPSAIKSAVIAPDHNIYLTDGHHTVATYRAIAGAKAFPFSVRITQDWSKLASMADFWQRMQQQRLTWLIDANGNALSPQQLPQQVGLETMQNDPYRSVVYFLRGIAYDKPDNAPPFLEFYLGSWLRLHQPFAPQQLTTKQGYMNYLALAAQALVAAQGSAKASSQEDSPTLAQLGQRKTINYKKLEKLGAPGGKLSILFKE